MKTVLSIMPGLRAPAFFLALLGVIAPSVVAAQSQPMRPPVSNQPVPGELELAKMIWSTMAMVDHANAPNEILRQTNELLIPQNAMCQFVTMFIGIDLRV